MNEIKSFIKTGNFNNPYELKEVYEIIDFYKNNHNIISVNITFARGGVPADTLMIMYEDISERCICGSTEFEYRQTMTTIPNQWYCSKCGKPRGTTLLVK